MSHEKISKARDRHVDYMDKFLDQVKIEDSEVALTKDLVGLIRPVKRSATDVIAMILENLPSDKDVASKISKQIENFNEALDDLTMYMKDRVEFKKDEIDFSKNPMVNLKEVYELLFRLNYSTRKTYGLLPDELR